MGLRNEFTCQKILNLIIHRHGTNQANGSNRNQQGYTGNRGSYNAAYKPSLTDALSVTSILRLVSHHNADDTADETNDCSQTEEARSCCDNAQNQRGDCLIVVVGVNHKVISFFVFLILIFNINFSWSGRRGSNPQQPDWKSGTLPIELHPHGLY